MKTHDLKCYPAFFQAIADGTKTFELRRNDRGFAVGDRLHLREWEEPDDPKDGRYTGRELDVDVTFMIRGPLMGLQAGFVAMSVRRVEEPAP